MKSSSQALVLVLGAARERVRELRRIADSPYGAGNIPANASTKSVIAYVAKLSAEADSIDRAIRKLEA